MGFREDVYSIMKACDAYVHSVNWEGFGLAVVEAMASGLPVIASGVSGLKDIVKGVGLLFNPGDVSDLVKKIKYLFSSEHIYNRFKILSIKKSHDYSFDKYVSDTIETYFRLLNKKI